MFIYYGESTLIQIYVCTSGIQQDDLIAPLQANLTHDSITIFKMYMMFQLITWFFH
jgi:hypothetical protein